MESGTGMKYGGRLTCPSAWKIGQNVKLTLTLDRSKWPSICRTDPDRREAWFEVIRWNDPGRQLIMCNVVNITSPGACQGNFTPGTSGCGCVSKTDAHFTLEFNSVMEFSSFGNWSVDTYCLRTDFSKPLQFHVAPECNVRLVCENNTYGARCQESCGHCADDQTCNARTGHCLACLDGWLPPLCKQGCENKTYGARCQESCGQCVNNQACNATTGHCLACQDGSLPPLCKQACENKTYGARCLESCGHCADDQTCNASTGHCLACLDGWLPPLCKQGCENKTYGARCQESCGHCADDQTCNANTGHCLGCLDGWLPPFCKQERRISYNKIDAMSDMPQPHDDFRIEIHSEW
ncbi:multiple epidermal growth factor-like domains protein 10 [Littorina saxatilis]|uniref:multiple epidermal growth factor-like domains protein 10 n=1 Tax=Littorina saxatilis TaxID=31220 RepID=UPI0038B42FCD